jgi:alpha-tubulin suppressor-like RCC1 family protein
MNRYGQLGSRSRDSAVPLVIAGIHAVEIVASEKHTCARTVDGAVSCWGMNVYGELGNGTNKYCSSIAPCVDVPPDLAKARETGKFGEPLAPLQKPAAVPGLKAIELAAGAYHTCAITSGWSVVCWGSNHSGQLGNDKMKESFVPAVVATPIFDQGRETVLGHATSD